MLSSKRILLLLLFFVVSSCDFPTLPSLDLCNTQFKGGECYIQSMRQESLNIQSYSDNAIILNYLLEDSSILVADSIAYDIPEIANVRIDMYNILGQKVRTLVNGTHQPGMYHVRWNGTNDFGNPVSSGMYFYRISSEEFISVKKLVLMK